MKFELTKKQLDIVKSLENLGYDIMSYTFSNCSGIGISVNITFKLGKSGVEHTLDITDYDTW